MSDNPIRENLARVLSKRLGLRQAAIQAWLTREGISGIGDLHKKYPDRNHAETMQCVVESVEDMVLTGAAPKRERPIICEEFKL